MWSQPFGECGGFSMKASIFSSTHTTLLIILMARGGSAPSAALTWALFEPVWGTGVALRMAVSLQILGLVAGVVAISLQLTQSKWAALLGGLALCTGRYLYFSIGEASLVAIAGLPLIWGFFLCLRMDTLIRPMAAIGVVFCTVWTALENPYLAPILPSVLLVTSIQKWVQGRTRLAVVMCGTGALGLMGLMWVATLFKGAANPDYPREVAGQMVSLLGRSWEIIDLPWARLTWWTLAWPEPLNWTVGVDDARQASGGRYLGLSVVAIGLYGLVHAKLWRWLALGVLCFALALGSVHFGLSGLFLFLNGLMDSIARPLTQPTRFVLVLQLVLALGVASAAQLAFQKHKGYALALAGFLLCDAFWVGGLGLEIPTTPLPEVDCSVTGPVLLWPHDAQDGAQSQSQLYQLSHEQPSPHTAIASWATTEVYDGPEGRRLSGQSACQSLEAGTAWVSQHYCGGGAPAWWRRAPRGLWFLRSLSLGIELRGPGPLIGPCSAGTSRKACEEWMDPRRHLLLVTEFRKQPSTKGFQQSSRFGHAQSVVQRNRAGERYSFFISRRLQAANRGVAQLLV